MKKSACATSTSTSPTGSSAKKTMKAKKYGPKRTEKAFNANAPLMRRTRSI